MAPHHRLTPTLSPASDALGVGGSSAHRILLTGVSAAKAGPADSVFAIAGLICAATTLACRKWHMVGVGAALTYTYVCWRTTRRIIGWVLFSNIRWW